MEKGPPPRDRPPAQSKTHILRKEFDVAKSDFDSGGSCWGAVGVHEGLWTSIWIQAGITIAFAAKLWQVRDLGSYNLAVLGNFQLGYKLGILDMADWVPWGHRYPVFPGKQKARGLLTFVRHGQREQLLRLFESFAGKDPDEVIRILRPGLTAQAERALRAQGDL